MVGSGLSGWKPAEKKKPRPSTPILLRRLHGPGPEHLYSNVSESSEYIPWTVVPGALPCGHQRPRASSGAGFLRRLCCSVHVCHTVRAWPLPRHGEPGRPHPSSSPTSGDRGSSAAYRTLSIPNLFLLRQGGLLEGVRTADNADGIYLFFN